MHKNRQLLERRGKYKKIQDLFRSLSLFWYISTSFFGKLDKEEAEHMMYTFITTFIVQFLESIWRLLKAFFIFSIKRERLSYWGRQWWKMMEILNILDIGSQSVKTLKSFSFFEEKKYIYSLAGRKCFIYSHGKITI